MRGTGADRIFEELQKFLSPRSIWQKVLVPHYYFLKSFGTSATKLKVAQNVFNSSLQLYNTFRTLTLRIILFRKGLT